MLTSLIAAIALGYWANSLQKPTFSSLFDDGKATPDGHANHPPVQSSEKQSPEINGGISSSISPPPVVDLGEADKWADQFEPAESPSQVVNFGAMDINVEDPVISVNGETVNYGDALDVEDYVGSKTNIVRDFGDSLYEEALDTDTLVEDEADIQAEEAELPRL